jgi:dihydropteroate synthase
MASKQQMAPPEPIGSIASLDFSHPLIMGVVNVTPDSFYDGGAFLDPAAAIDHGRQLVTEGADILDIGGESTRPGADPVAPAEELDRVIPVIKGLAGAGVPLSIDTRHASVMTAALDAGAQIINDVTALTYDPESLNVAARAKGPIVLMHAQGKPQDMQEAPQYDDVVAEVIAYFEGRLAACQDVGIDENRLILDPGIGFGKALQHNLALLSGLDALHALGRPLLLGVSRKSFIDHITPVPDARDRLPGSLAAALAGIDQGVHILRVHDVAQTRQALDVWQAINPS